MELSCLVILVEVFIADELKILHMLYPSLGSKAGWNVLYMMCEVIDIQIYRCVVEVM